ncbi:REP [Eucalyptus urophylla associated virus]|nr:REP [Eucalyptus urophylla associated virus]
MLGEHREKGRKNKWRLRSRQVLLTYMYGDDGEGPSAQDVKEKIESLGGKCTVAKEVAPSTGRVHLHVFARKPTPFITRNSKYFDIVLYHPNVKAITTNPRGVWDYVTKGGNILVQDVPRPDPHTRAKQEQEVFFTALQSATDADDMLRIVREGAPRTFCTSFNSISAAAKYKFPHSSIPEYTSPSGLCSDLSGLDDLRDWIAEFIPNHSRERDRGPADSSPIPESTPSLTEGSISDWSGLSSAEDEVDASFSVTEEPDKRWEPIRYTASPPDPHPALKVPQVRPKSLILWGKSRTGKTLFARSLGPHIYHATEFNLACHTDDAEYAIFDDLKDGMRTKGFDYKCWLGGQHQFNCTDKYTKKRVISWGKPSIFITNDDPMMQAGVDFDWLRENVTIVHVEHRLAWVA